MKKPSLKFMPSIVGWSVGCAGGLVLLALMVKWAWNSFFAGVLGYRVMDWNATLALCFWILLAVVIYVGGREAGGK